MPFGNFTHQFQMAILRGVFLVIPITPIHPLQLARPHSTFHPSIHPPTYPATYELMHPSHFVSSQFVVALCTISTGCRQAAFGPPNPVPAQIWPKVTILVQTVVMNVHDFHGRHQAF